MSAPWGACWAVCAKTSIACASGRVALFCTHEGGPGKTLLRLRRTLAGNDIVGERDFLAPLAHSAASAQEGCHWVEKTMASMEARR